VADGAEATRHDTFDPSRRTDALSGRTSTAQGTARRFPTPPNRFTPSAEGIGQQVRSASRLADEAAAAATATANVDACAFLAAIGNGRQSDRADRAADHAAGAQLDDRGGRARCRRQGLCGVATEVKALAVQTQSATERSPRRSRRCRRTPPDRRTPVIDLAAIEAIRPSRERQRRWASRTTSPARWPDAASAPTSSSRSATAPATIGHATRQAEAHGDSVANPAGCDAFAQS